jgi:hypothetical protein
MLKEYKYIYNISGITSLKAFLNEQNSIFKAYAKDQKAFLSYVGSDGKSNLDRIWENYEAKERLKYVIVYNEGNLDFIKPNTLLTAPKDKTNIEVLSITGKNQFLVQQDLKGYWGKQLLTMQNDPRYVPKEQITVSDTVTAQHPNCQVWVWMRSLNKIIDVSPFIEHLSTTVNETGSFTMSLAAINSLSDVKSAGAEVFSETNINKNNKYDLNTPFFHKNIMTNDVVFIRHENLFIDVDVKSSIEGGYAIPPSKIPKQNFDMIGLVDNSSVSYQYSPTDISVEVRGRDLSKLLIEDSSLFFTNRFVEDSKRLFVNLQDDDRWMKRIFASAKYENEFVKSFRSIRDTIGFVINQLANIGIVDDNLFAAYGKRKVKVHRIDNVTDDYLKSVDINGIWQIINVLIDPSVEQRRIADSALVQPDGNLISQFYKVCQEPFVEFFGDTYGDTFSFIVRQPPFNKESVLGWLQDNKTIEVESKDVVRGPDLSFSEEVYTWFEVQPQNSHRALSTIPVVALPQYINIWGNKGKRIESNYISRLAIGGEHEKTDGNLFQKAVIEDLKYLVDIYAPLPFTRQGTITINRDRRIKRGTFIRFKPTKEIFYVDSVTHDYRAGKSSVDATTTLTVSRGMVEDYIEGKFVSSKRDTTITSTAQTGSITEGASFSINVTASKGNKMSYFNIVDSELIRTQLIQLLKSGGQTYASTKSTSTKFGVNEDILNFFLQRRQFD